MSPLRNAKEYGKATNDVEFQWWTKHKLFNGKFLLKLGSTGGALGFLSEPFDLEVFVCFVFKDNLDPHKFH